MNEKQFLKELNIDNESGDVTCDILVKLINSQDNSLNSKKSNILTKLVNKNNESKSVEDIIRDNFETIFGKTPDSYKRLLLQILIESPNLSHIINEKSDIVLKGLRGIKNAFKIMIIELLKENKGFNDINARFIEENVEEILSGNQAYDLFDIIQSVKGVSNIVDGELNSILENKQLEILRGILDEATKCRAENSSNRQKNLDDYAVTLSIKIKELLEDEGKSWIDINYIKSGSYSDVYEIGEKVIKIGGPRETYNIPNHRRILQPLTRINYFSDEEGNGVFACIEISDKVEKLNEEDEEIDKLYEIYRELREDGIIWTDVKFSNVGKLKKDNVPTFNGEEMYVAPNSVGFDKDVKHPPLKKGDWVIIDSDYLYRQEDKNINWLRNNHSREFEKRWQMEQQVKIAAKHNKDNKQPHKPIEDQTK